MHISNISTLTTTQVVQLSPSLAPLTASFDALLDQYEDDYLSMQLDDVIVGAIAQIVSLAVSQVRSSLT